jgi:superoxide dismutase, Fe-Mn family
VPILVLDMHEHAYHIEFGANAAAYVDAFMRLIDWTVVAERLMEALR